MTGTERTPVPPHARPMARRGRRVDARRRAELASIYDWAAPSLASLSALEPKLLPFLQDAPLHTRHFVMLAVAGFEAQALLPPETLAFALAAQPRRQVLGMLFGQDLGTTRVLQNLPDMTFEMSTYLALAEVLASSARRRALRDLKSVSEGAIMRLSTAQERTISTYRGRLIAAFGEVGLDFVRRGLLALCSGSEESQLLTRLNALENPYRLSHLVGRMVRQLMLPDPPWTGTEIVCPLRSVEDLRRAGMRLENCLNSTDVFFEALSGKRAFYLVDTEPRCAVSLIRHPMLGLWYVDAVASRRNGAPPPSVKRRVLGIFQEAGFASLEATPLVAEFAQLRRDRA